MHLPCRCGDDLDMLVDQPSFRVSGQVTALMPARPGMSVEMFLHALTRIRPCQDNTVLTERDAFDLDKRPLEVVPPERCHSLRSASKRSTVVPSELSRKLLTNERSRADSLHT
ncbi:hypothetical protein AXH82_00140 [Microbacterium sp. PAMC 28756]|nr:hypothetical protein AXH82_00140 [Microbacterium sp. PAMC 28756]